MKTLVIGYGNTLRCDDGVGPVIAKQVALWHLPQVQSLAIHQLIPELAEDIARAEVVCFVDAWLQTAEEHQESCRLERLAPESTTTPLDHCWSPSLLLHLSQSLYGCQPRAYQLWVAAKRFDYGETLSPCAIQGVYWAIQTIKNIVKQEQPCYA